MTRKKTLCRFSTDVIFLNTFNLWLVESMGVEPMDVEGWQDLFVSLMVSFLAHS
jgi:hypothetical protein